MTITGATDPMDEAPARLRDPLLQPFRLKRLSLRNRIMSTSHAATIDAYVATGEPFDKAGGYAIQGLAAAFITHLEGSYSGVMGLPLAETAALLARIGRPVL